MLIRKGEIRYYYTQTYRPTKDTKRLHLFFRGRVDAIDRSRYDLSNSDTLTYTVTSMLSLLDNEPRYMLKIIDKYVEVRDRNYITFPVGRANVIDTMGQNHVQLDKIERTRLSTNTSFSSILSPLPLHPLPTARWRPTTVLPANVPAQ